MKKKYYKYILVFLFCFVITFLYNFFFLNINCDEIWNYGFSYNIIHGLVPYRDFNVVVTPLFFFIGSIFIKIFGYHIYSYDIYISVIVSVLILLCYKKWGKSSLLLLFFFVPHFAPSYNAFCCFLMVIILFINDGNNKYKNFWIGLVIGLIFLSKQSIGIVVFFVLLLLFSDKLRLFIGFIIPCLFFLIYLIINNCVYDFVNYCFLGLFEFGKSNLHFNPLYILFFLIFLTIIIYGCIKSKFKDSSLIIVLCFQIVAYPIFDGNHIMLGVSLYFVYLFDKYIDNINRYFKYYIFISLSFLISFCSLPKYNYHLYDDESFLHYKGAYGSALQNVLFYDNIIKSLKKYIIAFDDGYDNVFIYSISRTDFAYVCKLDLGYPIGKFDLINKGNMGYDGENRYISELKKKCDVESCLFVVDNDNIIFEQASQKIYNYVINNYRKIDNVSDDFVNYSIYDNGDVVNE